MHVQGKQKDDALVIAVDCYFPHGTQRDAVPTFFVVSEQLFFLKCLALVVLFSFSENTIYFNYTKLSSQILAKSKLIEFFHFNQSGITIQPINACQTQKFAICVYYSLPSFRSQNISIIVLYEPFVAPLQMVCKITSPYRSFPFV